MSDKSPLYELTISFVLLSVMGEFARYFISDKTRAIA